MVIFPLDPYEDATLNPLWQHAVRGLDAAAEHAGDVRWLTLWGGIMGDIGPITISDELRSFSELQVLELEHYSEVHPTEVLAELAALHTLIFLGNEFAPSGMALGPHLCQMEGLRALYLDGFFPLSLTDDISRCAALRTLWVEDCGVQGGEIITSLEKLEELSIDFDLGEGLAKLTQLKRLRIWWDGCVPDSIRDLSLRTLAIQGLGPMVLPDWLGQMESLRELDLCQCDVQQLPEGLSGLTRLEITGTPLLEQATDLRARFPEAEIIT